MNQTEIAYQNKDITSKFLAENLKGKTFNVYGLDLPEVKQVLPTNIPTVKANELRLDNLFELEDGSIALVDYESDYEKQDKVKYLNYVTGIANRYLQDKKECPIIHMVVIYTGDIDRRQVSAEYDIGAVKMSLETAFLSELDSRGIYSQLRDKVEKNQMLSDEELMEFIILPLTYRTKEEKQEKVRETVELAVKIQDRKQQVFALAGILVFADKVIDRETAGRIRRAIEMTQVAQIFEEEKQQALAQATQIFEEEKQQALAQAEQTFEEKQRQIVIRMIKKDYSTEEIASLVSSYSQDDVEMLRREITGK
ncbi:MAG: hypothetical protein K2I96_05415 [Lachnospiraceae bacterium]|nr:hypothetical protein [Lachnospiraceae bacterium]